MIAMSRPDQSPKSDPPNPLNAAVELFLVSFGFVGSTVAILAWLFWLYKQTDGRMLIALGVTVLAVLVPLILSVRTFRQTNKDRERFWAEHPELLAKKHADALNNTTFRDYLHDLPQLMLRWAGRLACIDLLHLSSLRCAIERHSIQTTVQLSGTNCDFRESGVHFSCDSDF